MLLYNVAVHTCYHGCWFDLFGALSDLQSKCSIARSGRPNHMACVTPRSHGGDAGGSPPRRPTRHVTGTVSQRRLEKIMNNLLKIGFDYEDLGTFHPLGNFSGMLNSLMGETVRPLPLTCEWDKVPEAFKAHIYPTLESYFNLAEWYNNQDKVVIDQNVYTVGERVRLGLELKLRLLWRKNKNRIKADHYAKHTSPDEVKNHPPPPRVWGDRTEDDWNQLVDWWSQPDQVSRSLQNAVNRAKNTIITHQGKKSFAQGRNEYKIITSLALVQDPVSKSLEGPAR
ncbi:hypothetical protein Tco_0526991 [Tanacetum coccineum]